MSTDKPWIELTAAEREADYADRKVQLGVLVTMVRMHRAEGCDARPLCPGGEAVEALLSIHPVMLNDFLLTCVAGLADRDEEIDNLRALVDQERGRQWAMVVERDTALAELHVAQADAEAGWAAYRQAREGR